MICRTCKRKVPVDLASEGNPRVSSPFCSDRCRLVDLGAWLDGAHRIVAPLSDDDLDQGFSDDDGGTSGSN